MFAVLSFWCLLLIWVYQKYYRVSCKFELPPTLDGSLPLVGYTHKLFTGGDTRRLWRVISKVIYEILQKGGIIHINIGPHLFYGITDPDDCMTVANSCLEKNYLYEFTKSLLGEGLFSITTKIPMYKRHRKVISKAFNQKLLDGFMDVFNTQSMYIVEDVASEVDQGPFDHSLSIKYRSLVIICQTAMGVDTNENEDFLTSLEHLFNLYAQRVQSFWMHSEFIYNWTSMKTVEKRYTTFLHETTNKIIHERITQRNQSSIDSDANISGVKSKAFLDLLLDLPAEEAFTEEEIRDEVNTMILAGLHTSSLSLIYALILLGSYPVVQDKLYCELQEVFGESNRDVEKNDLSKLVYMEAVINEVIRLYPVGPVLPRNVNQPLKLKNYTLRPGSTCVILVYGLHRDPKIWGSDVEEFSPERWVDPARLPINPNAFAGFSLGKRGCIGKTFAMMSMKTSLAHFLRHYRVSADVTMLDLQLDYMLQPAAGCEITIQRRNKQNVLSE